MAAGCSTILAVDGVIRQVIEKANGGIYGPPGNDRALAEAVLYLASHPEEAKRMGENARRYVIKHFNRSDQAKKFLNLIKFLTNSH